MEKTAAVALLLLGVLCLAQAADPLRSAFEDFQRTHNKVYKTAAEKESRFNIFKQSLERAAKLQEANKGTATFGVTKFSDLTPEEFRSAYLMNPNKVANLTAERKRSAPQEEFVNSRNVKGCSPSTTTFNWLSCGVVTGVRNQGQCGSCWAYSAAETMESYCALAGGPLQFYSTEQIIDCDTTDAGCGGGIPTNAFSYIESAGGIETNAKYPYIAENGTPGTCKFNKADTVCTVTSVKTISGETGIYQQASSSSGGPVSVCVDASTWQDYTGGVMSSCPSQIDHCVQLTGYNNYGSAGAYWIVRNSWGGDWGEKGYIWLSIGQNLCGIGNEASVVAVKVLQGTTSTTHSTTSTTHATSTSETSSPSTSLSSSPSSSSPSSSHTSGPSSSPSSSHTSGPSSSPSSSHTSGPSSSPSSSHTSGPSSSPSSSPSSHSSGPSSSTHSSTESTGTSTASTTPTGSSTASTASTTPTGSSTTPTGSSTTPTGSSTTPTGSSTSPTGSSTTPTGSSTGSDTSNSGSSTSGSDTSNSGSSTSGSATSGGGSSTSGGGSSTSGGGGSSSGGDDDGGSSTSGSSSDDDNDDDDALWPKGNVDVNDELGHKYVAMVQNYASRHQVWITFAIGGAALVVIVSTLAAVIYLRTRQTPVRQNQQI
eukprot:TRINITY_DN55_c0_g1_i3.p1 TRINITY_DN55_c0_g1~~TRINITY_DN55_c0_g1_i3.p1  ORF type:complete len:664 (+),score=187.19 TRINITY_DN55_c0_g1_i3:40-1992(+)